MKKKNHLSFGFKKLKKKHLLDRINQLEDLVDRLYAKVELLLNEASRRKEPPQPDVAPFVTLPKIDPFDAARCSRCNADLQKNPMCMSVDCPYAMRVTCSTDNHL